MVSREVSCKTFAKIAPMNDLPVPMKVSQS